MAKHSRSQKSAKRQRPASWKEGRVPLVINLSPELKAVFELLAKNAGLTFSQFASMVLEEQVMNRPVMEDSVRDKVDQALKENLTLIADIIDPPLAPRPGNIGKKTMPN
jgi:hypothetical protein